MNNIISSKCNNNFILYIIITLMDINYHKSKNGELFANLEKADILNSENTQNFLPIYTRFFSLNQTNYNNIVLNNEWNVQSVNYKEKENANIYNTFLFNTQTKKKKESSVFIKFAPLLDPCKYIIGKYDTNNKELFNLPNITNENVYSKIKNYNNSAYVDSFFTYLNSKLLRAHNFFHGVDYFGSFITVKKDYEVNIADDLEYLVDSDFFNQNKNKLFKVDDYDYLFENDCDSKSGRAPIKINKSMTCNSNTSIEMLDDNDLADAAVPFDTTQTINNDIIEIGIHDSKQKDVKDLDSVSIVSITSNKSNNSACSDSCSSTSSYTSDENDGSDDEMDCDEDDDDDDDEGTASTSSMTEYTDDSDEMSCSDVSASDEIINVTFEKFPVQLIFMERCKNTLDDILMNGGMNYDEWCSCLMQVIMILITYQRTFSFTHNDLHTNNIMYCDTDVQYLYYKYENKYYKVPTFGKIYKIIDFGRGIYRFKGKIFCSDSFKSGEDAATQYNTEPFLNKNKPRLEPNYSFDLCRLACSIFDYLIEDITNIKGALKDPIAKLINEWCLDDKGINILYKSNGDDRYPDFKLYKMIARIVHNHTPDNQLKREHFSRFVCNNIGKTNDLLDIDSIPSYAN